MFSIMNVLGILQSNRLPDKGGGGLGNLGPDKHYGCKVVIVLEWITM